jgi:hypothetical protein
MVGAHCGIWWRSFKSLRTKYIRSWIQVKPSPTYILALLDLQFAVWNSNETRLFTRYRQFSRIRQYKRRQGSLWLSSCVLKMKQASPRAVSLCDRIVKLSLQWMMWSQCSSGECAWVLFLQMLRFPLLAQKVVRSPWIALSYLRLKQTTIPKMMFARLFVLIWWLE